MSYIAKTSIEKVKDVDIVHVVGSVVDLKKNGANYKALSPFTDEKTPSFIVSPSKQIWTDFSSGLSGNNISFIMEYHKCDFVEALTIIAHLASITLEMEQQTVAEKKQLEQYTSSINLNNQVTKKYIDQYKILDSSHWAKNELIGRNFSKDSIIEFSLGYAPHDFKFLTNTLLQNGLFNKGQELGLIKSKNGKNYDSYVDRIVFPIKDINGNVIGFGARKNTNDDNTKDYPKYLNSATSKVYDKGTALYGVFQAKHEISKQGNVIVTEGYTDVIACHQNGLTNTVCTSGTSPLGVGHLNILKKYCNHITLMRDGDDAGIKSMLKEVPNLIKNGFGVSVCILPKGEDPDSYTRNNNEYSLYDYVDNNKEDGLLWLAKFRKNAAGTNKESLATAYRVTTNVLSTISDDFLKNQYITDFCKLFGVTKTEVKNRLKKLESEVKEQTKSVESEELSPQNLPKGADYKQFIEDGFAIVGNKYFFQNNGGGFFMGTNFSINPLYHIKNNNDNKRICLIESEKYNIVIDFPTDSFINYNQFKTILLERTPFTFRPGTSTFHIALVMDKILYNFEEALELKNIGWQPEGFYAYADGVYYNESFNKINEYGIVKIKTNEGESKTQSYYLPAFSKMYVQSRIDDDPYENDRNYIRKQTTITLSEWMNHLTKVYPRDFTSIGIAFVIASVFRDLFQKRWGSFPHLFCAGEKGSGKSEFANSLASLFSYNLKAFDLNSGSLVGYYRTLNRLTNGCTFLDEYNDGIDDRMFQGLKAGYNGMGRETGVATNDNRTKSTKVNSALIIAGQYFSNKDDSALNTRSINLQFIKIDPKSRTQEEIDNYYTLKDWQNAGITSIIEEILIHRSYVEENLNETYNDVFRNLKVRLGNVEYQERALSNFATIITPIKLLFEKVNFPFTYDYLFELAQKEIVANSNLVSESDGTAVFWKAIEYMNATGVTVNNREYWISNDHEVRDKKTNNLLFKNTNGDKILYIRLTLLHQRYSETISRRKNEEPIPENSLKNYFKGKRYFIGRLNSIRNAGVSNSAYVFNYTQMMNTGILNLEQINYSSGVDGN